MNIGGRTVLILGGSGLVGLVVARRLFEYRPRRVVISGLTREEADAGVAGLREDADAAGIELTPVWGDLFVPKAMKDRRRTELLDDRGERAAFLDDLYGDLTEDVVRRSALGALVLEHRPEIIVDCVNTATAFAYQNVFESAMRLRDEATDGGADLDAVERHLATLYLPQLIRHVQVALEAMRRAETALYLKVGTAGTGGMGLNIPFTHSEERPSRTLLAKSGVAGAHTLLLFLMARTSGAPAVKEIKPTAAISWKRIAFGEIRRAGTPIERYDADAALPVAEAFTDAAAKTARAAGGTLRGVYLDAGENGWFTRDEFETLTSLGLMEYITPEEIADNLIREIRGFSTGRDVVAALDGATSGPTYRAGVLREVALERMARLEEEHDVHAVAYEMLGPPRLSKLLFEAAILARLFDGLPAAAELVPDETATAAEKLIGADEDLRVRILSIGLPILMPDGERLLRGPSVKVAPGPDQDPADPRLIENGWVDLRAENWERWSARSAAVLDAAAREPGPERGSGADHLPADGAEIRPGRLGAWIFRHEDDGERIKR